MRKIYIKSLIKTSQRMDTAGKHFEADRMMIIASSLASNLPAMIPPVLNDIFSKVGARLYVVGGAVRDALLGNKPKDIDLCTDLEPEQVIHLCESHGLKTFPTGIEHGTVTVLVGSEPIEVTTFRSDLETDGRHAKVGFVKDINEDLARRDFTINAMAADSKGNIIDPFNGTQDLADGVIKAVGNPIDRFSEDLLRIIRAARFASRYGFSIEEETANAMQIMCERQSPVGSVSIERIVDEFNKCFNTNNSKQFIEIMNSLGILDKLFPGINDFVVAKFKEVVDKIPNQYRWCALFMWLNPQQVEPLARKLKMAMDIVPLAQKCAEIRPMIEQIATQGELSEQERRRFQNQCGIYFEQLSDIFEPIHNSNDIIRYIFDKNIERFSPMLQGRDIMQPGTKPGKWVGDALRDAESRQLEHFVEHGSNLDRNELIDYIKQKYNI